MNAILPPPTGRLDVDSFDRFQEEVATWVETCFGAESAADTVIRTHRFIEEAVELAQAMRVPKDEVLQIVDYVYSRPIGDVHQEVGGTITTLTALCNSVKLPLRWAAVTELIRDWDKIDLIRQKSKTKPSFRSAPPLPDLTPIEIFEREDFGYWIRLAHLSRVTEVVRALHAEGVPIIDIAEKAGVDAVVILDLLK